MAIESAVFDRSDSFNLSARLLLGVTLFLLGSCKGETSTFYNTIGSLLLVGRVCLFGEIELVSFGIDPRGDFDATKLISTL